MQQARYRRTDTVIPRVRGPWVVRLTDRRRDGAAGAGAGVARVFTGDRASVWEDGEVPGGAGRGGGRRQHHSVNVPRGQPCGPDSG